MLQAGGSTKAFQTGGAALAAVRASAPPVADRLKPDDYRRFGLDPDTPLLPGRDRPIHAWLAKEVLPLLAQKPLPAKVINLALAMLHRDPLEAAGRDRGTLLVHTCLAATPDPHAAHFKVLAPVREMLWRFCDMAVARERAELHRYGQMLGHDARQRTEAHAAIDEGLPLAASDLYRRFAAPRNRIAEARGIVAPPGVLFSTTCSQLYATFDPSVGTELITTSHLGETLTTGGRTRTFISETVFAIIPDDASVRLCHFSASGVERWHGRLFGTPLTAIDFAYGEYRIPYDAWREDI